MVFHNEGPSSLSDTPRKEQLVFKTELNLRRRSSPVVLLSDQQRSVLGRFLHKGKRNNHKKDQLKQFCKEEGAGAFMHRWAVLSFVCKMVQFDILSFDNGRNTAKVR